MKTLIYPRSAEHCAPLLERAQRRAAAAGLDLRAVGLPLIETGPLREAAARESLRAALDSLGEYSWIVLSSAAAVEYSGLSGASRVFAVGKKTAEAVRAHLGVEPWVPTVQNVRGVAAEFPVASGVARVLVLNTNYGPGQENARVLRAALEEKGWQVDVVAAYETVELTAPTPEQQALVAGADALCFTSGSTVRSFLRVFPGAVRPSSSLGEGTIIGSIGPRTTHALEALGVGAADHSLVTAPEPSGEGLVDVVVDKLIERQENES
ncbi:MAG: uroporphyrinogen-III synthase [Corynebacterium sp.]|nr:uroporphyrinogen-III synthase [Corynebacterium sp.]